MVICYGEPLCVAPYRGDFINMRRWRRGSAKMTLSLTAAGQASFENQKHAMAYEWSGEKACYNTLSASGTMVWQFCTQPMAPANHVKTLYNENFRPTNSWKIMASVHSWHPIRSHFQNAGARSCDSGTVANQFFVLDWDCAKVRIIKQSEKKNSAEN